MTRFRSWVALCVGAGLGLTACDTGEEPMDAGLSADAGSGEDCLRGVCVDACDADTSAWDESLHEDLRIIATFCRPADAFGTQIDGSESFVVDLTVTEVSDGSELSLHRWMATPGEPPSPSTLNTVLVTHDGFLAPGQYVTTSPNGRSIAFGYTLVDADISGGIFRLLTMDGTAEGEIAADGNYDAAWLDESVLLINGLGLGAHIGQALYAVVFDGAEPRTLRVGTGIGEFSGGVAVTADYVLAGGYFSDGSNRVFTVPRAAVEAVIAGSSDEILFTDADEVVADAVEVDGASASSFDLIGDRFITKRYSDPEYEYTGLAMQRTEWSSGGGGLSLGAPEELTTGPAFLDAYPAADGGLFLRFAEGLLLVAWGE